VKWVLTAFVVFGVVTAGAYAATEPVVDVRDVSLEPGGTADADITARNAGTVTATVVGEGAGSVRVRLSGIGGASATASVPASGDVQPRLALEASHDTEPGEYTVEVEAWRLPGENGERTVERFTVTVEDG